MITIRKKNEATLIVESKDSGILMEVGEFFTFFAEGYKFIPAFKNKLWDGKIRLFCQRSNTLPYGLLFHLAEFAKQRGYELKLAPDVAPANVPSMESLLSYIDSLTITGGKDIIKPRDYQIDAITHALRESRSLLISPTRISSPISSPRTSRCWFTRGTRITSATSLAARPGRWRSSGPASRSASATST